MAKTYDPKKILITFGPNIITGFADGSFVKVTKDVENFSLLVGADGEGTRIKSANQSGTIEFILMKSSASNDILSAIAIADKLSSTGVLPLLVKDQSGSSLYTSEQAWIQKEPDGEFSKDETTRTWILRTDVIATYHGGNN